MFPQHPHRGFETIIIVLEGLMGHSDSLGAVGRFSKDDVLWITAGKDVNHTEMAIWIIEIVPDAH